MHPNVIFLILLLGFLVATLVSIELGVRLGRYRLAKSADASDSGAGVVDGAVFAILGLLVAFTISGAAGRLDARRQLITREANAIGTAYLRLDTLPADAQPALRTLFGQYLDARLKMHEKLLDEQAQEQYRQDLSKIQGEIWSQAVAACKREPMPATMLVLPALNEMIDVTTMRWMAVRTHIPTVILVLVAVIALVASLLVGHAMAAHKARSVLHMILFPVVIAVSIYVIVDLEYPRAGLIRIDPADQAMVQLRDLIK